MNKRPSVYSEEVAQQVVELMLPKVIAYLKADGATDDEVGGDELDNIRKELRDAIQFDDDAYKICRNLERGCWEVDDELHDLVGMVAFKRHDVHRKFVKEWVRSQGISAKHKAGDVVTFKTNMGKEERGEVTRVEPEIAQYIIFCEHLGHVRKGVGSHGFYINYEDVTC